MNTGTPERPEGRKEGTQPDEKRLNETRDEKPLDLNSPTVDAVLRDVLGASGQGLPGFQPEGFTVLETVGEGGFGVVVRARDEKLDREVALKVLRPRQLLAPDAAERFLGEARALARVRHPNVLTIYSVIEDGAHAALVMEFLDGEPLSAVLERQGPYGAGECVQMGIELCQALAAVHHAGLVHRDVKTPNIMREKGGRIVLTDFGLGARISERGWVETGFVAGSPLFMAPEQIEGRAVDRRTDLYALGVVLYNLSTGRFPAVAKDLPALFERVRSGELTPLRDARPELPKAFTDVVMKALRADPDERHQSAGEMEQALTSCLSGRRSPTLATTAVEPLAEEPAGASSRAGSARGPLYALAAMAVIAAGISLALDWSSRFDVETVSLWTLDSKGDEWLVPEGGTVGREQELFLRFKADADLHVYVLNEDARNRRLLLFPMKESQLRNPLAANKEHALPGTVNVVTADGVVTNDILWVVDTSGGTEQLIIVASLSPIDELEAIAQAPAPTDSELRYPAVKQPGMDGVLHRLRGIGGKVYRERKKIAAGDERLATFLEELSGATGSGEEASEVWVRRITLRNPP